MRPIFRSSGDDNGIGSALSRRQGSPHSSCHPAHLAGAGQAGVESHTLVAMVAPACVKSVTSNHMGIWFGVLQNLAGWDLTAGEAISMERALEM